MEQKRTPGRKPGRTYTDPIIFRAPDGFRAMIAEYAKLVGETQSEYMRVAIEQRNDREKRRAGVK